MKVVDTFPPEKLRKAASDPVPGQIEEESFPINITSKEEFKVDEVLAYKESKGNLSY